MIDTPHAEVDLWLSPQPDSLDGATARHYEMMLSPAEKTRWQRFMRAADRDRFLHARALTRTVLSRYLGDLAPAQLSFSQGSWGKPTLAALVDGQQLFFNLSHTQGIAVLAVTRAGEVGVDVEALERKVELLALSERYFAAAEHRQIAALAGDARRERFFSVWTLKEAYLKARGLGLSLGLDSFAFDYQHDTAIRLHETASVHSGGGWFFRLLRYQGFRIALALQHSSTAPVQLTLRHGQPGQTFVRV